VIECDDNAVDVWLNAIPIILGLCSRSYTYRLYTMRIEISLIFSEMSTGGDVITDTVSMCCAGTNRNLDYYYKV